MALLIQIQDGQPINHPTYDVNLFQAYGQIPQGWQLFEQSPMPSLSMYQVFVSNQPAYQLVNGVWTDVWEVREMTMEEKLAKQQVVRDAFAARDQASNWAEWVFDEDTCAMKPPIPRPSPVEGVVVFWCGADANWKAAPEHPTDGRQYKFDFFAWQWVEVVN